MAKTEKWIEIKRRLAEIVLIHDKEFCVYADGIKDDLRRTIDFLVNTHTSEQPLPAGPSREEVQHIQDQFAQLIGQARWVRDRLVNEGKHATEVIQLEQMAKQCIEAYTALEPFKETR